MSNLIGVVGPSGSGKSTSLRNLDPKNTFIIQVIDKQLPFPGNKKLYTKFNGDSGNLLVTDKAADIVKIMQYISNKRADIKTIIIDDAQYIMSNEFMRRSKEIGFQKFNDISYNTWSILSVARDLRDDLNVVYITHDEDLLDENGEILRKMKTIGKATDKYTNLEGLFTVVLFTKTLVDNEDNIVYQFETNSSRNTAKSPMGMFNERYIDNDLDLVIQNITNYNNQNN